MAPRRPHQRRMRLPQATPPARTSLGRSLFGPRWHPGHTRTPGLLWTQVRLSDRAQWMRWVYHHPHEARKHMSLLPGRAFNSMGSDYAEGDLVLHAGGGGAFGLHVFGKDKYVELLKRCQALQARSST